MISNAAALRSRSPAKIVSVCPLGRPAGRTGQNDARFELLYAVIRHVTDRQWTDLDAVLFPAGFFRGRDWYAPLWFEERCDQLLSGEIGQVCQRAARRLARASPGCLLVVGVDTNKPTWEWRGDQLVAAFAGEDVVGLARKLFPVDADTNEDGRAPYLLAAHDFNDPKRFVRLPSGAMAALSTCYDAFVFAELALGPTGKRAAMRYVLTRDGPDDLTVEGRNRLLGQLTEQLAQHAPQAHLISIHNFERPGAEIYWQRHGIATACAALDGGFAVGAGHFAERLPAQLERAPLASAKIHRSHLFLSHNRRERKHPPTAGFVVTLTGCPRAQALVRLFQIP